MKRAVRHKRQDIFSFVPWVLSWLENESLRDRSFSANFSRSVLFLDS